MITNLRYAYDIILLATELQELVDRRYIHKDIPCTKSQNNFCRFIMASNTMFRLLFLHSYSRRSHLMTVVSQSGRTLGAAAAVTIHRLTRRAGHLHCRVMV